MRYFKTGLLIMLVCMITTTSFAEEQIRAKVFAYGVEICDPPVFTGVGEDTLYLNGFPYEPRNINERELPDENNEFFQAIAELACNQHELMQSAKVTGYATADRDGYEAGLQARAEVLLNSDLVQSVEINPTGLYIIWADGESESLTVPRQRIQRPSTEEVHERLMAKFWRDYSKGKFIAFGNRYYVTSPPERQAQIAQLMAIIDTGETSDFDNTALKNERLRQDLQNTARYNEGSE